MKVIALGLALFVGITCGAEIKIKCFDDDALVTLAETLSNKCTGFDLTCTPSCDDAMKCYFKEMGLWNPDTKSINWDNLKAEFELLYSHENIGTADKVFEEFKEAESGNVVDYVIVQRYLNVAKKYCTDSLGNDSPTCDKKCE